MIKFLIKKFILNYENINDTSVRKAYGNLASIVGIINNLLLSLFKFVAGTLANSVSISGDAINNLSDAGSSIISLISFKLSSRPADEKHPYGHARYECIAAMVVACIVTVLGLDLMKKSVLKIMNPASIEFNWVSVIILFLSIGIKFWMYRYNTHLGKLTKSSVMEATATDSISDVLATGAVLVSTLLSPLIQFNLDGYMGVIVSIIILVAGVGIISSALDEILGKAPDREFVKEIEETIKRYPGVLGMHDLVMHEYGVNTLFATAHVEVDCTEDVMKSHELIDEIERHCKEHMNVNLVIHMDPVNIGDPLTRQLHDSILEVLIQIDPDLSIHDFRIVKKQTTINIVFDVVVPFHTTLSDQDILDRVVDFVRAEKGSDFSVMITFDHAYISQLKGDERRE